MDQAAIVALVRPVAAKIAPLPVEERIALLCALLTQEICNLPPSERDDALHDVIDDLPGIFRATQAGMREALANNARQP